MAEVCHKLLLHSKTWVEWRVLVVQMFSTMMLLDRTEASKQWQVITARCVEYCMHLWHSMRPEMLCRLA